MFLFTFFLCKKTCIFPHHCPNLLPYASVCQPLGCNPKEVVKSYFFKRGGCGNLSQPAPYGNKNGSSFNLSFTWNLTLLQSSTSMTGMGEFGPRRGNLWWVSSLILSLLESWHKNGYWDHYLMLCNNAGHQQMGCRTYTSYLLEEIRVRKGQKWSQDFSTQIQPIVRSYAAVFKASFFK